MSLLSKIEALIDEAVALVKEERARRALAAAPPVPGPTIYVPYTPYVPGPDEMRWTIPQGPTCGTVNVLATNPNAACCAPNIYPAWTWSGETRGPFVDHDRMFLVDEAQQPTYGNS